VESSHRFEFEGPDDPSAKATNLFSHENALRGEYKQ